MRGVFARLLVRNLRRRPELELPLEQHLLNAYDTLDALWWRLAKDGEQDGSYLHILESIGATQQMVLDLYEVRSRRE